MKVTVKMELRPFLDGIKALFCERFNVSASMTKSKKIISYVASTSKVNESKLDILNKRFV